MLEDLNRYADRLSGYTELRAQANSGTTVVMRKGVVLQNARSRNAGIAARCWGGGAFGFASEPATSDAAITRVLDEARSNASLIGHDRKLELPVTEPGLGEFDYRSDRSVLPHSDRIDRLKSINAYIESQYRGLLSYDLILSTLAMEKALITSAGAATYSYVPRAVLLVRMSIQANDGVVELFDDLGGFGEFEDHFDDITPVCASIDALYEQLRDKAEGRYCIAGQHDVILDSAVAGILAHEAIGHTCEADLVLGGSIAGEYLGRTVATELVTLTDHARRGPNGDASIAIHVDDEGTPCTDVTIIEDGVLKNFLTNKETALALGLEPTGNARAYEFSDEPLVRMRNTAFAPGSDKLEDMIASVDNGYYLLRSANGQADATSEFMFGITLGYEINNGKLGRAIRDTTISGVAFDMLQTVSAVSTDVSWSKGGMCGKKQLIPVGMGGPAIKCRMTMGGH